MRAISNILAALEARDIRVALSADRVRIVGPYRPEAEADLQELRDRKPELAAHLRSDATPKLVGLPPQLRSQRHPLSVFQHGWFVPDDPGSVPLELRRTPVALRLVGPFSPDAMVVALRQVIGRHEALRTRYGVADGAPYQEVLQHNDPVLRRINLEGLAQREFRAVIAATLRADIATPPAFAAGRPLRSWLFRRNEAVRVLALIIDHVALDNRTMNIVLDELFSVYRHLAEGDPIRLPDLDFQYIDYAVSAQPLQSIERLTQNEADWRERFGSTRPVDLRRGEPSCASAPGSTRGHEPIEVEDEIFETASAFAQSNGVTLPIVLVGVVAALLSRWSGQGRVLFGGVVDGRPRQMRNAAGCFIRTSPLLVDLADDPTISTLLARARRAYVDANDSRRASRVRAFPRLGHVSLNVQRKPDRVLYDRQSLAERGFGVAEQGGETEPTLLAESGAAGCSASGEPQGRPARLDVKAWRWDGELVDQSALDLHIYLFLRPHGMDGYSLFAADRLDPDAVRQFTRAIPRLLARIASGPDSQISEVLTAVSYGP